MSAESPRHTLQATALVHEAFIKLVGPRENPGTNQGDAFIYHIEGDTLPRWSRLSEVILENETNPREIDASVMLDGYDW